MNTSTIEKKVVTWLMSATKCSIAFSRNYAFDWECDVLGVTKLEYSHEVEVKVSKSDFLADFKNKKGKHYNTKYGKGCNYFWYAVPQKMESYAKQRLPEYAGLLVISDRGYVITKVKAPLLHGNTIEEQISDFWKSQALKLFYKNTTFGM